MQKKISRRKAIIRRRIFLACCVTAIALIAVIIALSVSACKKANIKDNSSVTKPQTNNTTSFENVSSADNDTPQYVEINGVTLDATYTNLLLVNADNPLPDDYDTNVRKDLVEIDAKYRNNNYVTKIHKDVYPYITAMVAAAQAEGVDLRVWSPFRSYADQKVLFQNQVNRVGGDEAKAATVVARPGTSEHNTGICADFNMADDAFENTKMYTWMVKNAENYGFVMRYSAEKQSLTGVIHESWHWRFVGINAAKEMNDLGMCLEEYVEYKKINTN